MTNSSDTSKNQVVDLLLKDMGLAGQDRDAIDLHAYLQVLLKYKWGILALTLLAAIGSYLYVSTLQPRFKSEAILLYDPPSATNYGTVNDIAAMDAYYNSSYNEYRLFQAQQMIMTSRQFAEDVVDEYELWNHPFFSARSTTQNEEGWLSRHLPEWVPFTSDTDDEVAPAVSSTDDRRELYRERAIGTVRGGMTLTGNSDVLALNLGFVSASPEFAQEMANKLADYYVQYELDQRMQDFNQATEWVVQRTEELRQNLLESERRFQEFKESESIGLLGSDSGLIERQLEDVITRLSEEEKKVEALSQTLARMDSKDSNFGQIVDSAELLNYPGVRSAMDAELDAQKSVDELGLVYGPLHPRMIEAVANQERAQEKLEAEIVLVRASLESDLNAAIQNQERLTDEFTMLRAQQQSFEKKQFDLSSLERDKNMNQELYDLFVNRFKELNVGNNVNSPSIRLIDSAPLPVVPFWPNKTRSMIMYSAAAFILAVVLAFLLEYLNKTIRHPEQVEEKLGIPVLGSLRQIPSTRRKKPDAEHYFVDNSGSGFAESVRTIRTGVMLSGLDKPHKIIAVTSTIPGEGKTTVSMNLACALGQLERVLLIDADMRRASLGTRAGLKQAEKGLADVAAGLEAFEDCVHHYEKGNIDILPVGTIPPNPQELLSSKKLGEMLRSVSEKYDRVIIDTAPAHLVSDSKLVARWSSGVVYVIRAESTDAHLAKREISELRKVNSTIIGGVLNGMSDARMKGSYHYGYKGGSYGDGYGYGDYYSNSGKG